MLNRSKIPPHSTDAEMAVLGAMLIEKDAVESVLEVIKDPKCFYSEIHRRIFQTIAEMAISVPPKPIDILTLSEELRKKGWLEEIGGQKYLTDLMDKVSTAAHTAAYARMVKEKYQLRELISVSTKIIEQSFDESEDVKKIMDAAESDILKVSQTNSENGFIKSDDLAKMTLERLEYLYSRHSAITGVPSGFSRLDDMTGGFQPSDLIILAARPSMGKTALALNIIYNACVEQPADKKTAVAFFSMEMDACSIMQRLIGSGAKANLGQIRKGVFPKDIWGSLISVAQKIAESPLYIDASTNLGILDIRSRCRKLVTQLNGEGKKLGLVVIDYLQLIRGSGRTESRQQEVSEISRLLKDLARSLSIPVIALSQLSRKSEDKARDGNRPQLSDLRESGSIEQDADLVALIHRPDYYNHSDPTIQGKAEIIIAKHRNGSVGTVELMFRREFTKFENMPINFEGIPGDEAVEMVM